jgi:RimJ/RimL family protein N-acetyltransferase
MQMKRSRRSRILFGVREAVGKDAVSIGDVVNRVASERIYVVPESSRENWREIKGRKGSIIVARTDGKIVGMAYLVRGKFEKDRHVAFLGISVLKEFRGVGIGAGLIDKLMKWAEKQPGLEKISLTVFSTNRPAINLYRKFGFQEEGVSKRQYRINGKYVDEVTMSKFLS